MNGNWDDEKKEFLLLIFELLCALDYHQLKEQVGEIGAPPKTNIDKEQYIARLAILLGINADLHRVFDGELHFYFYSGQETGKAIEDALELARHSKDFMLH